MQSDSIDVKIFTASESKKWQDVIFTGSGAPVHQSPTEEIPMLDSLLRRNNPGRDSQTPAGQIREALAPGQPAPVAKPESAPTEAPKPAPQLRTERPVPADENLSKLIVGPDIKLKGTEITDCDTLIVEGRVEASMDSRVIQIDEQGVFVGRVGIDVAEIRGRFEGELTARKQLVIRSTGHLSGKIRYGKVMIEEGGELSGDVAAISPAVDRVI
jgi:cytoskeletal protein CcmA (bactofilin family)